MKKLMVDCETLGVGERPVLLSIGAVVFDDAEIHKYFHVQIDIESAKAHGFSVDQSTLDWWDQQDPIAKKDAFSGERDIQDALAALVRFYKVNECTQIWSKGSIADIRWINNALNYFDMRQPWKFWQEMCFRTFLEMSPRVSVAFEGVPHNALDDAAHQARQFIAVKHKQAEAAQLKHQFEMLANKTAELEFQLLQHSLNTPNAVLATDEFLTKEIREKVKSFLEREKIQTGLLYSTLKKELA